MLLLTFTVPKFGCRRRQPPEFPLATVSLFRLSVPPEFTLNTRTALLPLIVTVCPLPSMVVSALIAMVDARVIVPLQLKVTVPPPASAASRWASSQTLTIPPACAGDAGRASASRTRIATRCLIRMVFTPFPEN